MKNNTTPSNSAEDDTANQAAIQQGNTIGDVFTRYLSEWEIGFLGYYIAITSTNHALSDNKHGVIFALLLHSTGLGYLYYNNSPNTKIKIYAGAMLVTTMATIATHVLSTPHSLPETYGPGAS